VMKWSSTLAAILVIAEAAGVCATLVLKSVHN
jgi:hypothetical protein